MRDRRQSHAVQPRGRCLWRVAYEALLRRELGLVRRLVLGPAGDELFPDGRQSGGPHQRLASALVASPVVLGASPLCRIPFAFRPPPRTRRTNGRGATWAIDRPDAQHRHARHDTRQARPLSTLDSLTDSQSLTVDSRQPSTHPLERQSPRLPSVAVPQSSSPSRPHPRRTSFLASFRLGVKRLPNVAVSTPNRQSKNRTTCPSPRP